MKWYILLLSLACCSFSACVVPVQLTKVTLTESFTQSFDFGKEDEASVTIPMQSLLGENWEMLSQSDSLITKLHSKNVISKGNLTASVSLVPGSKPLEFFISGVGTYDIIDTSDNRIYFSARFHIVENHFPIKELTKNENSTFTIPVYFRQVLRNHSYTKKTVEQNKIFSFEPTSDIQIDLEIKKIGNKNSILSVNYVALHKISLLDAENRQHQLGFIKFEEDNMDHKILDLRQMKIAVRPYRNLRP